MKTLELKCKFCGVIEQYEYDEHNPKDKSCGCVTLRNKWRSFSFKTTQSDFPELEIFQVCPNCLFKVNPKDVEWQPEEWKKLILVDKYCHHDYV